MANTPPILQHFKADHLPDELRQVSEKFQTLAHELVEEIGQAGPELSTALRKLLESKDAAVRAKLETLGE